MKTRYLILAVSLVALLFLGCSKSGEKGQDPLSGGVASPKTGSFPKDIPIYPEQQQLKTQSAQRVARATYLTASETVKVTDYYDEQLPAEKWMKIGNVEKEDKTMLTFRKDHQILHVTLETDPETRLTRVTLLLNR